MQGACGCVPQWGLEVRGQTVGGFGYLPREFVFPVFSGFPLLPVAGSSAKVYVVDGGK